MGEEFHASILYGAGMVEGYTYIQSLQGGDVCGDGRVQVRIKKQMDGLNLVKTRHSFHSFVNSLIYFRLAVFGGISFLMFKVGGLRVTRMLVTNSPRWRILNVWREALYSDGWGTTALQTKI